MRARVYNGHRGRVVHLPEWVTLDVPDWMSHVPAKVRCGRCGRIEIFEGTLVNDERALGRFVVWHRRCKDPELVRAAVEAAARSKAERPESGGLIRWVKRGR